MPHYLPHIRTLSLARREVILAGALGTVVAVASGVAYGLSGWTGLEAAVGAGVVCLASAAAALAISHVYRRPEEAFKGMALAMAVRMGVPLLLLIGIHLTAGLQDRIVSYYFVMFYLAALVIEVPLSLPATGRFDGRCRVTHDAM
jgi:hypothetical protein